jgi:hypothetical protein
MLAQAGNDWGWVVPVVVVLIYVLSYLWNAFIGAAQAQKNRAPQARGERPLPQPGQRPAPQPADDTVQAKLNAEIEEFLRRANERRTDKNRGGNKPKQEPQRAQTPQQKSQKQKSDDSEKKRSRQRESVSQSVEQHLGSRSFESREQKLADDVQQSEREMSQHLQQVFEHQLGSLGTTTAEGQPTSGETVTTRTAEQKAEALAVAGLLVNQENLRRAVILREILERPVDRW